MKSGIGDMRYGSHMTHWYQVKTPSNDTYDGYCAQPAKGDPRGEDREAVRMNNSDRNKLIKLIIYLRNNASGNAIFNPVEGSSFWGTSNDNRRFVFAHTIIGVLYDNDYHGISEYPTEETKVTDAISQLQTLVANNSAVWQAAQNYILLRTAAAEEGQVVVWIEPSGSITVQKRDAETGQATPQGGASFNGITFNVYDGSTLIASETLANGTTSATFSGLDLDKNYTVTETIGTNTTYNLSATASQTARITSSTSPATVTFNNSVKRGNLTVNKTDAETGTCSSIEELSLAGATFRIVNTSANAIYYNGATIASGGTVLTRTLGANECSFAVNNLPYGTYQIIETAAATGYVLDSTPRTVTIPTNNNANVTYTFVNQPIRGDITFVKMDQNNQTPMQNTVFSISSLDSNDQIKETHVVVTDANGVINTASSFNLHSNHTNGYDELYNDYIDEQIAYAGYGTWFGLDKNGQQLAVNDNLGALPYGTYIIQELKCDANKFCSNLINEKLTVRITAPGVVDLGNWNNTCSQFSIGTVAVDEADHDHYVVEGQDAVIKDTVSFCAKKNIEFTITGILMDKSTGEPLLIDGHTVEQSTTIKPETDCGTLEMLFPINTTGLTGKSIVVFEKLFYKDQEKARHEDIDDPAQTIDVISLGTIAVDNSDDDKLITPSEETIIKDIVSYCAPAGQPYTIRGVLMDKTTGSPILSNGEPVTQSITFTPSQNCGTIELIFPAIDTTAIVGHPIVAYETLYKVTPGGPGEPPTEEPLLPHEDLDDEDQTVYVIDLYTTIRPYQNDSKVFPLNSDITVTDTVHYCLQPGLEYTIKGIVMDKTTGNGLLANSAPVEAVTTFTPTEPCGETEMHFTFNTSNLNGAKLVVFESLYHNDELLIEHHDLDNEPESFEIDINPPETGYITSPIDGTTENRHIEYLIVSALALIPAIVYKANHIFARRKVTFNK